MNYALFTIIDILQLQLLVRISFSHNSPFLSSLLHSSYFLLSKMWIIRFLCDKYLIRKFDFWNKTPSAGSRKIEENGKVEWNLESWEEKERGMREINIGEISSRNQTAGRDIYSPTHSLITTDIEPGLAISNYYKESSTCSMKNYLALHKIRKCGSKIMHFSNFFFFIEKYPEEETEIRQNRVCMGGRGQNRYSKGCTKI